GLRRLVVPPRLPVPGLPKLSPGFLSRFPTDLPSRAPRVTFCRGLPLASETVSNGADARRPLSLPPLSADRPAQSLSSQEGGHRTFRPYAEKARAAAGDRAAQYRGASRPPASSALAVRIASSAH